LLTMDGNGSSDPDQSVGDKIVSYEWSIDGTSVGSGAQRVLNWTAIADEGFNDGPATHTVSLVVTDSFGQQSASATVNWTVDNEPPTLALASSSGHALAVGHDFPLSLSSNDTGNDTLTTWYVN